MFLQKLNLTPFFFPEESAAPIEDKNLSTEDVIELLGEEGDEEEPLELEDKKKTAKGDKGGDDTDKEGEKSLEDEIEEDLKEPDEDKLELAVPEKRKEILAKYPNVFKDFPGLEKAYYREQKYSEILPTIEDAQEAANKAGLLDGYEQELLEGNTVSILQAVKDGDPEAFHKVVDNYLPNLYKVDEGAYYHLLGNIIKHTIATMVSDGDEENVAAANIVNEFVFGTKKFSPPSRLSKDEPKNEKVDEIESRENQFLQQQFETHGEALSNKVENVLKSTVDKNIDPRESMSDYVRKNATRDALNNLETLMEGDIRFKSILDRLWERAFNDNFSSNSLDRIKQAYLSKAKTLLPTVIKKARNEALQGLGRREDGEVKKGPLPVGQTRKASSSSNSTGKTDKDRAQAIPKGTKTLDFLMQD